MRTGCCSRAVPKCRHSGFAGDMIERHGIAQPSGLTVTSGGLGAVSLPGASDQYFLLLLISSDHDCYLTPPLRLLSPLPGHARKFIS